jgi:prepilin-type N-terminal cleavage/methylation domain-containing protein
MFIESPKRRRRGFSLVEVLVAMALLGTVLLGIMTLFVFGRKNVYSGKQMTEAIAMGTQVMETLTALDRDGIKAAFGLPDGAGASVGPINGVTYANSFLRTTSSIGTGEDTRGWLARWNTELTTNNKFKDGVVSIVFTPVKDGASPPNDPPQFSTGTVIRIRVVVTWNEGSRHRGIFMDAVKVDRSID